MGAWPSGVRIEAYTRPDVESGLLWKLYKRLKSYPLSLMEKKILIRSLGLKQSQRQIMRELKIRSSSYFNQVRVKAMGIVKRYGK